MSVSLKRFHLYSTLFILDECLCYGLLLVGNTPHDCALYHCLPVPVASSATAARQKRLTTRRPVTPDSYPGGGGWRYTMTEHIDILRRPPYPLVLVLELADLDGFEELDASDTFAHDNTGNYSHGENNSVGVPEFVPAPGATARLLDRMISEECAAFLRLPPSAPGRPPFDGRPWLRSALLALADRGLLASADYERLRDEVARAAPGALARYKQGRGWTCVVSHAAQ